MARKVKPRPYDTTNRQRQAAETRRRIFEASQELFTRDGYVTTTIAAIAEHAGVAVQTVYASAKSKRDILKGILDLSISGRTSKYRSRPARDGERSRPNLTPGPS